MDCWDAVVDAEGLTVTLAEVDAGGCTVDVYGMKEVVLRD